MRALLEKHRNSGSTLPLIGGHRGCACHYQENSIAAMEEGIRRGADYLEIDVQLTKDNVPIIFHDITVDDKTSLTGYVQDHTYKALKDAYNVPTLVEALEWAKKSGAYLALELKSCAYINGENNMRLMPLLNDAVKQFDLFNQVEAFSVDWRALSELKRINRSFDIGLIVPTIPSDPVKLLKEYDAFIYLSYVYNITREALAYMQSSGYFVSGAILSDPRLTRYATEIGVDMFEFDHPEEIGRPEYGYYK